MNVLTKRWTFFNIGILIISALWIVLTALSTKDVSKNIVEAPMEGFLAPDFELVTDNNDIVQLSQYRGQIVIVNFWASWCMPCRVEMPALQKVFEAYNDQGFQILAVNAPDDNPIKATEFAVANSLTFPILFDTDGQVFRKYAVHALPTTLIIDSDGIIQKHLIGGPLPESLLEAEVIGLLRQNGVE